MPVARAAATSGSNASTASVVLLRLVQRLGAREGSLEPGALVGRDAAREEAGVDSQAVGEPFDRPLGRARLAALDLGHVLLREAVARELALRQSRGDAELAEPFSETKPFGARPASGAAGCFSHGHALGALVSQAHTSLKRKFAGLTIPRLSVFIAKVGQPCGTQNHLTELLDEQARRSYSERTLQPGRTPGRGSQGVRRTLPAEERKAGGPQIRLLFPAESGAPLEKAPEPQPGPFHLVLRPLRLPGHACGVRGLRCAFRSRPCAAPAHVGRGTRRRARSAAEPGRGGRRGWPGARRRPGGRLGGRPCRGFRPRA